MHVVPQRYVERPRVAPKVIRKKAKIKKKNPIIEFFRFLVTISFLLAFAVLFLDICSAFSSIFW